MRVDPAIEQRMLAALGERNWGDDPTPSVDVYHDPDADGAITVTVRWLLNKEPTRATALKDTATIMAAIGKEGIHFDKLVLYGIAQLVGKDGKPFAFPVARFERPRDAQSFAVELYHPALKK